ncbi:penicillin acylase family protein, partial [Algoriphagus sp.]|uniref:penicillin acylase family protein n=1 Tax=Algoriphagus sp. TaxID=1872435 RepID=UPI0025FA19DF
APIRKNFSGMVPVPGDGRYEWDGYLPIIQKPNTLNPKEGFFASANQNIVPEDYEHWDAIGFTWADPFRGDRIEEVLSAGNKLNMEDMKALQVDYQSIPARMLVPFLMDLPFTGKSAEAKERLKDWNFTLDPTSIEAAIYVSWENAIRDLAAARFIPDAGKDIIRSIQMQKIMDWIFAPDSRFGPNPNQGRDQFLAEAFEKGITNLEEILGEDMSKWQYGQEKFKHTYMAHALGGLVNDELKAKLDVGPLPRGGNSYTPGSTGGNNRQTSGASFRMIVNTEDWDAAVGTNGPGQSGNPESPFYKNLFEPWAKDQYFPVYYSREKIETAAIEKMLLRPKD